ncbi:MAG: hypothetical protein ACRDIL_07215, partial [Candidatus Limnocylindrales bacterium]
MTVDGSRRGENAMVVVAVALSAIATVVLMVTAAGDGTIADSPLDLGWLWLFIAFGACEVFALRVERRQGEQYGFTAAQVPLAAGLIYAEPTTLVLARLLAVVIVLLVLRQRRPAEAAYELGAQLAQTVGAIVVVRGVLGGAELVSTRGAVALALALLTSYVVALVALAALIATVTRSLPGWRGMLVLAKSDLPAGVLNAAIGIGLALALWDHTSVELLLIAIVLACITSNRVYSRLYERRRGLEALHEFTKTVVRSIDMAQIASSVLGGARSLLNADDAVLLIETVAPGDPGRRFTLGTGGRGEECISVVELHGDLRAVIPDGTPRRFEVEPLSPAWLRARTSVAALAAPITRANGSVFGALVVTQARRKA